MKCVVLLTLSLLTLIAKGANLGEPLVFTGTCDASAASALSGDLFVVANDEDNILRFYRTSQPGKPVQTFDLEPILALKGKSEMDLEGAARLSDKVFFISSHGRNADGKYAPNRHRFFALKFTEQPNGTKVELAGKPYAKLSEDLAKDPRYARFHLTEAAGLPPRSPTGLNIEALTDATNGTLLIGFRSPIPEHHALLAPLLNPNEVISGQPPRFGDPILLDLGGLGLRGISSTEKGYYLLAGPADIPKIDVKLMNQPERGVIGIGEPPVISPAAAISNAVANAIGVRVPNLPHTPDRVITALQKEGLFV